MWKMRKSNGNREGVRVQWSRTDTPRVMRKYYNYFLYKSQIVGIYILPKFGWLNLKCQRKSFFQSSRSQKMNRNSRTFFQGLGVKSFLMHARNFHSFVWYEVSRHWYMSHYVISSEILVALWPSISRDLQLSSCIVVCVFAWNVICLESGSFWLANSFECRKQNLLKAV